MSGTKYKEPTRKQIERALYQAAMKGYIVCPCGNKYEPDGECYCGRPSPLRGII